MEHHGGEFETKCVHSGTVIDPTTGAVITPIYQTSTFAQSTPGVNYSAGCMYTRLKNPTRTALEKAIKELECGKLCFVTSSGMGAISLLYFSFLKAGDHVLSIDDVYGGTRELNDSVLERLGIEFSYTDMNIDNLESKIKKNTKLIYLESPTNPTLKVTDIKKVTALAKKHGIMTVLDSTFMSPYHQCGMELGCDFVINSCTKYINGHSDVVMGALVGNDMKHFDRLFKVYKSLGVNPSPFDCFLCQRGLKTLVVRMQATAKNAQTIAEFLEKHEMVEKCLYPGLKSHPTHDIAKKQVKEGAVGYGGVITFYLKGDAEQAATFLKSLKVFTLAVSLGGVESLAAGVPKEMREKLGLFDNLVRLAVGIENTKDLLNDLDQALKKAKK